MFETRRVGEIGCLSKGVGGESFNQEWISRVSSWKGSNVSSYYAVVVLFEICYL